MSSALSTRTLSPAQIETAILFSIGVNKKNAIAGKKRRPLFIWGPPGVGKSAIMEQICKKENYLLVDVRLTTMEPSDLKGIPVPISRKISDAVQKMVNGEEQSTETIELSDDDEVVEVKWAIPAFLPQPDMPDGSWSGKFNGKTYNGFILFLDELPNAAPSIQAGAYQLVLDGKLGEYSLPTNGYVYAAGNRDTDRGGTFQMPLPLVNRFGHLEMKESFKEWIRIAILGGYNERVTGYLSANETALMRFDPSTSDKGFETPRSWEGVSDILNYHDENPGTSATVLNAMLAGYIGNKGATDFIVHCDSTINLPDADKILDGEITQLPADCQGQTALAYTLTIRLGAKLDNRFRELNKIEVTRTRNAEEKAFFKCVDRFIVFMMNNFRPEMNVLGARMMLHMYTFLDDYSKLTKWDEFLETYADMIAEA